MRSLRLEEIQNMQRMDISPVKYELRDVEGELKKLTTSRLDMDCRINDLEIRKDALETHLGAILRGEVKPDPSHTNTVDSGPREKFLQDTKDMHLSEKEILNAS